MGCILFTYTIFANFCVPQFEKVTVSIACRLRVLIRLCLCLCVAQTAAEPGDLRTLVVSLFNSMLPSILVYLLAFFGLLHCWFNAFAEITR